MEKTRIINGSVFKGVENPQFEKNYDYCLVTPAGENLEMTYFHIDEKKEALLNKLAGTLNVNTKTSVLFCLTDDASILPPNLGCFVGITKERNEEDSNR